MSRHFVSRSTRHAIYLGAFRYPTRVVSRKLTTTPPLASQGQSGTDSDQKPLPHPEGSNTLMILSALGALGGLYYYYTRGQPAIDRESARREEEEMEKKVRELGETGKNKVESISKQGQRDWEKLKDTTSGARGRATEAGTDLTGRARQSAHEAQVKLGELKDMAERRLSDVRDRSEKKIEENKEEVVRQAREAENKARGWFGWGGSK